MSAQDELPPNWCVLFESYGQHVLFTALSQVVGTFDSHGEAVDAAWMYFGITREELATMRAAVERCAELERLVDDAEHGRATALTVRDAQAERCSKAEAALAKVTAERDALSFSAKAIANAIDAERELCSEDDAARDIPSDPHAAFTEGMFRAYAIARGWERATPTEGE